MDRPTSDDVVADAFVKLYRLLGEGKGPQVALRPYLMQMVRHGAIDTRRRSREDPVDPAASSTPSGSVLDQELPDHAEDHANRSMAREALMRLPERWRAVLWLGEVEGLDRHEIGTMLGLSPGGVSALAKRAREGLRRAYLAVHLERPTGEACAAANAAMPDYVRGRLGAADTARMDEHLASCPACARAARELGLINTRLGAVVAPALLGAVGDRYLASRTSHRDPGHVRGAQRRMGTRHLGGALRRRRRRRDGTRCARSCLCGAGAGRRCRRLADRQDRVRQHPGGAGSRHQYRLDARTPACSRRRRLAGSRSCPGLPVPAGRPG